ncbi:MAG: acyltransferase [Paracoccaceae bacterium]
MAEQEAFQRFLGQRYFSSLDGVRCLSIGAVLWHHSPLYDPESTSFLLLNRGFLGVDLFFVLSGFLITTLLLREETGNGRISIPAFYRRRALRILPVYFLLVTALSVYYLLIKGEVQYGPLVPYYYLFLANFLTGDIPLLAPTWSLSVEEQYYMVWPLIIVLSLGFARARGWLLVLAIGFCAVAQQSGMWPGPLPTEHAIWALPGGAYEAILLGSFLAVVLNNRQGYRWVWALLRHRWTPVVIFTVLLVLLEVLPSALTGWPELLIHLTMTLLLASVVLREDHVLRPVLSFAPVARIGTISYGIYLYHLIGLDFTTRILGRLGIEKGALDTWISLVYVLVSIVIAEISFRTYERFFLGLK